MFENRTRRQQVPLPRTRIGPLLKLPSNGQVRWLSHTCQFHTGVTSWFYIVFTCLHVFSSSPDHDSELTKTSHACATHSSLPAQGTDFTPKRVRVVFAFTWYRWEISYRREIFAPAQQPLWTQAGEARAGMTFCSGVMLTNTKPREETNVNSRRHESRHGVMWTPSNYTVDWVLWVSFVKICVTSNFYRLELE